MYRLNRVRLSNQFFFFNELIFILSTMNDSERIHQTNKSRANSCSFMWSMKSRLLLWSTVQNALEMISSTHTEKCSTWRKMAATYWKLTSRFATVRMFIVKRWKVTNGMISALLFSPFVEIFILFYCNFNAICYIFLVPRNVILLVLIEDLTDTDSLRLNLLKLLLYVLLIIPMPFIAQIFVL